MYAIVEIAGQQFKVEKGKRIFVHRLDSEEGKSVDFDRVLLIENNGKILVGEPYVKGAYIEGKVLEHTKGDKVVVFKKKRRKGYKVKKGHRQQFSQVEIVAINEKGYVKKPVKAESAEDKPKATDKPAATAAKTKPAEKDQAAKATPTARKTTAAKATTTTSKTTAAKKPAAAKATTEKKPAAKKPATSDKAATAKTATTKTGEKKVSAAKKPAAAKKSGSEGATGTGKAKPATKTDRGKKDEKK